MKKVLLFTAVISAFSFASCKKDRVCTCTYSSGGSTYSASTTIHATKKKATDACDAMSTSSYVTCEIK